MADQWIWDNNASTTLTAGIGTLDTTLSVSDGSLFTAPAAGFRAYLTIEEGTLVEIVELTGISVNDLTVVRAQDGTTAQTFTSAATVSGRLTAGQLSDLMQVDNGGDAIGTNATRVQPGRTSASQTASGFQSIVVGFSSKATGANAIGHGTNSRGEAQAAVAVGFDAYVADVRGISVGEDAQVVVGAPYGIAVGWLAKVAATDGIAMGRGTDIVAGADESIALGRAADCRVKFSFRHNGMPLVARDSTGDNAEFPLFHAASEAVVFSDEIDLTQTAADDLVAITLPTGAHFYPDEVGVVITDANTVTVQPDVSFGITGNAVALLAQTTTAANAQFGRDRFTSPVTGNGQASLTASLKVAATATTLLGRFYFKGLWVEDEP